MSRYLFLDGGCLRARLNEVSKRFCDGAPLSVNWYGPGGGYVKIFYYDALPTQRPNQPVEEYQAERQIVENLHAKLATIDRFRVNEGDTRYRRGRGLEQKKVDVMIAVDMMIHTIRRNMTEAALLAGDADFTPLLNALSNEGMFVTLLHPPKASKDLLAAADARHALTVRQIFDWLEPASQTLFGAFPSYSYRAAAHDHQCRRLWLAEDGREVWLSLSNNDIWASWPAPDRADRMCLVGGTWRNIRFAAFDDFGVEFPEELPPG